MHDYGKQAEAGSPVINSLPEYIAEEVLRHMFHSFRSVIWPDRDVLAVAVGRVHDM
jgi:hypothetical protein